MRADRSFALTSRSAAETQRVGRELGRLLGSGDTVLLEGDLGTGKTTLARGIARGLRVPARIPVTSPTFTLIHEYEGRVKLFHMDWYRLSSMRREDEEEMSARLSDGDAVCLVEWPERCPRLWPQERLEISFNHRGLKKRRLEIRACGKIYRNMIRSIRIKMRAKK